MGNNSVDCIFCFISLTHFVFRFYSQFSTKIAVFDFDGRMRLDGGDDYGFVHVANEKYEGVELIDWFEGAEAK